MGILPGSGPLGSGPTGPGSGFSVMPYTVAAWHTTSNFQTAFTTMRAHFENGEKFDG